MFCVCHQTEGHSHLFCLQLERDLRRPGDPVGFEGGPGARESGPGRGDSMRAGLRNKGDTVGLQAAVMPGMCLCVSTGQ